MRKVASVIGGTIVCAAVAGGTVSPASAVLSLNASSCDGKPYYQSLGNYSNPGQAALPLRCGNSAFGFNHIKNRGHLDGSTSANIQATLTYGEPDGPGTKELFSNSCSLLYIVTYGYNPYNGTDQRANPIGIVTAYPATVSTAPSVSTAATPLYGQKCAVIHPAGD